MVGWVWREDCSTTLIEGYHPQKILFKDMLRLGAPPLQRCRGRQAAAAGTPGAASSPAGAPRPSRTAARPPRSASPCNEEGENAEVGGVRGLHMFPSKLCSTPSTNPQDTLDLEADGAVAGLQTERAQGCGAPRHGRHATRHDRHSKHSVGQEACGVGVVLAAGGVGGMEELSTPPIF